MTSAVPFPLESLRRQLAWLPVLGLLALLIPAAIVGWAEREREAVRHRIAAFHDPAIGAAQEAMLAIDEIRLADASPPGERNSEWSRQRGFHLYELMLRMNTILALQREHEWPEAAATVARLQAMWSSEPGTAGTEPERLPPTVDLPALQLALGQLRLLHKHEQEALLNELDKGGRRFRGTILPLLLILIAAGAVAAWRVWRGIGSSIAAEASLREGLAESEARLRRAERGTRDGVWEWDLQTGAGFFSDRWLELLGYERGDIAPEYGSFLDLIHPEDRESVQTAINDHLENEKPFDQEMRLRRKTGDYLWVRSRGKTDRDPAGRPTCMTGAISDISARKRADRALAESEERLRLALASSGQGFFDLDLVTGRTVTSPEYATMIGEDPGTFEETNVRWTERLHPEDREPVRATFEKYVAGQIPEYAVEFRQRTRDGRWLWTLSIGKMIARDTDGKPLRMLGTHTNIHKRKLTELALAESQKRLEQAQRIALIGNWEVNLATGQVVWSDEVYRLFEVDPAEFGASLDAFRALIHHDDWPSVRDAYEQALRDHQPYRIVYRILLTDGRIRHIEEHCEVDLSNEGRPRNTHGTVQDVTRRMLAKEELRSALREKEILLREIHHRVKNNLQIIASLLYFQSRKVEGSAASEVFQEARNRLSSIILVHEKLYTSTDLAAVDFGDYARDLVGQLADSANLSTGRVNFKVEASAIHLPIQTAMPSGMILVELVTNVLKYAYPPGASGNATVRISSGDGCVTLEVHDQGLGFPEGFDPETTTSFGWQLISSLTRQLAGTASLNHDGGARVTVSFPQSPAA